MGDSENRNSDAFVPLGQTGIPKADIEKQLEKLLRSETFEGKRSEKRLLTHLVRESFAGNTARLRVADITRALFRRYDRGDSRVRGDTGRLRDYLDAYYASPEAKPGEIRFTIPERQYVVYAPRAAGASADQSAGGSGVPAIGRILEPGAEADVHQRVVVRGRIDSLDADLRPWLLVRTPSGVLHPQSRVSRKKPEWEGEVIIGRAQVGLDEGYAYEIMLVAADAEGEALFHEYLKTGEYGFGKVLPADCTVMDSRRVVRRDVRPPG